MHTPAEEQGLHAQRMQARVEHAALSLSPERWQELRATIAREAVRRHVVYVRDAAPGKPPVVEPVPIVPMPVVITPEQHAYVHAVSLTLLSALKRLPALYQQDPDVRRAIPLPADEEAWLCSGGARRHDPVFARLDALVDFKTPHWRDTLAFVEPNLSGVGGLHMGPSSDAIVERVVFPQLSSSSVPLARGPDLRELLFAEIADHLEWMGSGGRHVALIEPRETTPGPEEQEDLARHFHARFGVRVSHVDPRDLEVVGERVHVRGDAEPIDVAYRDYAVTDLLPLEKLGVDCAPFRKLLVDNRMISSLSAEIDAKSDFEVFTDPVLVERHFSSDEQDVLRRHVLWTRLVRERKTTDARGAVVDLLPWARTQQQHLVLKPNRSYGGYGVLVGTAVDRAGWERALDAAAQAPDQMVLQLRRDVPQYLTPHVDDDGRAVAEARYTVMGFAPSKYGVGMLGRVSGGQVVNVAQRGGLIAVAVARS